MGFFGFFMIYALRVNLSIAIVAMTENKTVVFENGTEYYVSQYFVRSGVPRKDCFSKKFRIDSLLS